MIRDYLGAVSTAATRKLPKGDRLLFVGRTRATIEAQVGPLGSADADEVAAALTALGDPDELAAKERERLQRARRRGAAAEPPTLWKPPGKTGRRDAPPGKPARGGPAGPQPRSGVAGTPPRRARSWPYRRAEPGDAPPAGPAQPAGPTPTEPTASGSGAAPEPAAPEPAAPEPAAPGPAAAGSPAPGAAAPTDSGAPGPGRPDAAPGSEVHVPAPRPPEPPPGPTVGPGVAGRTSWLAPPGTVGPGVSPGTTGAGGNGKTVGPGAVNGAGGPGTHNGTVGPGAPNGRAPAGPDGTGPAGPAGTAPAGPGRQTTGPGPDAADDTTGHLRPVEADPADGTKPLSIVPGMQTGPAGAEPAGRKFGAPAPLTEAWTLARKNPKEAVAILLLGVGGLSYPFPLWLIGALVALLSRQWSKRDKWLALIGPVGFAAICMVLLGFSGSGGFFHALGQATHQFGLLLRVGCVLCAGYLGWRLRRGPRRRKTPPWLRGRVPPR